MPDAVRCPYSLGADEIQRIDAFFFDIEKRTGLGCDIAIARHGQILYSQGYGLAKLEYGIPIATDTIFHIALVLKQLTAFAVALLEADDKLDLDTDGQVAGFLLSTGRVRNPRFQRVVDWP